LLQGCILRARICLSVAAVTAAQVLSCDALPERVGLAGERPTPRNGRPTLQSSCGPLAALSSSRLQARADDASRELGVTSDLIRLRATCALVKAQGAATRAPLIGSVHLSPAADASLP